MKISPSVPYPDLLLPLLHIKPAAPVASRSPCCNKIQAEKNWTLLRLATVFFILWIFPTAQLRQKGTFSSSQQEQVLSLQQVERFIQPFVAKKDGKMWPLLRRWPNRFRELFQEHGHDQFALQRAQLAAFLR